MSGNPDGSRCAQAAIRMGPTDCIARSLRDGAAHPPVYGWGCSKWLKPGHDWVDQRQIAAGLNPAAPATRVRRVWLLAVGRELERDGGVLGFAGWVDSELAGVLVLADDAQLVALDAHLQLGRDVLDPLAQVARDVFGDACIEQNLDLAATLADRFRVARVEELG